MNKLKGKNQMSDPITSAIEETENASKKGNKHGARARYYFLVGLQGKKIVHEVIEATDADEAQAAFLENHQIEAQVCEDGASLAGGGMGFYLAMGTGKSAAQRISVTVTPEQLARRTSKSIAAEFKGWMVYGSGLRACEVEGEKYRDDELISIEFGERIEPDSKVDKPKLKKREVIRLADLENVQAL